MILSLPVRIGILKMHNEQSEKIILLQAKELI